MEHSVYVPLLLPFLGDQNVVTAVVVAPLGKLSSLWTAIRVARATFISRPLELIFLATLVILLIGCGGTSTGAMGCHGLRIVEIPLFGRATVPASVQDDLGRKAGSAWDSFCPSESQAGPKMCVAAVTLTRRMEHRAGGLGCILGLQ